MPEIPQYTLTADVIDQVALDFESQGCLILDNFMPAAQVESLETEFRQTYEGSHSEHPFIQVGDGRRMTPVAVDGAINDPSVYAPAALLPVLDKLLGRNFVLSVISCVTAAAGAPPQHRHRDYPGLFHSPVDFFCSSYAINLFIPLVPLNEQTGTTRMWPGTHRQPIKEEDASPENAACPYIPAGSAMLMDYRLIHEGTANTSNTSRPILCVAYTRSWFLDTHHFRDIDPICISHAELEKVESSNRHLFARACQSQSSRR